MAVVIPKLERIDPTGPQSAGRLQLDAPNLLGATAPLREGVGALANATVDVIEQRQKSLRKQELAAKDLKATEAAIKYETKLKGDLTRIEQIGGDATPAYKAFDDGMAELENTTYTNVGEDAETRAILKEKIIKANGRVQDERTVNQTKQYYKWQKEVADSSVSLKRDNAMKSSQYLDVKNPATFGAVQSQIDEIEQTRISIGLQNGYDIKQVTDDNGVTRWDYSNAPAIETQIKGDIGDTVIPMVKALNASGKANEAKALIEGQKKWLNADDLAKLTSDNDEASVKNRALDELTKIGRNPSIDQINNLKGVGEDVKLKMREINHTNSLHRERENNQKVDSVMNKMYQDIQAAKGSDTPYVSAEDFKNRNPLWKNNKDMLSVENMKSIDKLVTNVEVTDPEAFNQAMRLVQNGELEGLSGQKFLALRSRIDDGIWKTMFSSYFRQNLPDTESRKQSNIAFSSKEVTGYFNKQTDQYGNFTFPRNKKGQYTNSNDEALVADSQRQLGEWIATNPSVTTAEIQDKSKELYNDALKAREEATPGWIKNVRSFMDSFKAQNPFIGGKRPTLSNETPPAVKITPDQVQNNPPAATTATQAATVPGSQQTAPQNGGNMAKYTPAQWFSAYDADPANRGKSFANPEDKKKAVRDYARKKLGK